MSKRPGTGKPRQTLCPSQPSARDVTAQIVIHKALSLAKRRQDARRHSDARAEFSRLYVAHYGLVANPADLTAEETRRILTHPQYVDPVGCPMDDRLFALEAAA